jgi:hypothetical protein
MLDKKKETISKWNELKLYFDGRNKSPLEHPEFIFYFILVIFGFGAIGVWSSFLSPNKDSAFDHANLINNIASFSVAIIAAGSIELMFTENKIIKNTLSFITLSIIAISAVFFMILFNTKNLYLYFLAIPFGLISLYIWWIANADNANLTRNFFVDQSEKSSSLSNSLNDYDE